MTFVLSTLSPRKLACYFGLATCFAERAFLARKRKKSHPVFSSVCKTILKELHCFFTLAWWGHVPLPLRFAIIIKGQHKHHIGHTTYLAKTPVAAHKGCHSPSMTLISCVHTYANRILGWSSQSPVTHWLALQNSTEWIVMCSFYCRFSADFLCVETVSAVRNWARGQRKGSSAWRHLLWHLDDIRSGVDFILLTVANLAHVYSDISFD